MLGESEIETETGPGGETISSYSGEFEEVITATGTEIEISWSEREEEVEAGEPPFVESESGTDRGTLRADDTRVYVTITEEDGMPVPLEEQEEEFFGWRIDPQVIVLGWTETLEPEAMGYQAL